MTDTGNRARKTSGTQGKRTEIRPEKVKQLLLRNCSGLHSTSSMRSPKRLGLKIPAFKDSPF